MGILPQHVPTLGVLSAGSYAVNDDGSVMISAEEALTEADIDMDAVKKELAAAQARTGAGDDKAKADAQIEVETLEAILK